MTGSLDAFVETGAGLANLAYGDQDLSSLKLTLGARAERKVKARDGVLTPRARIEYRHEFKDLDPASVSYADWLDGPTFLIFTDLFDRNEVLLGIGAQYNRGRTTFSLDYQATFAGEGDYAGQVNGQLSIKF